MRWPFAPAEERKGARNEPLPPENDGLPDSSRLSGLCPRCNKQSSFEVIGSVPVTFEGGFSMGSDGRKEPLVTDRVTVLICRHCHQGVAVVEEEWTGDAPSRLGRGRGGYVKFRGFHWWPLPDQNLPSAVPSLIGSAFSEATRTLAAKCPRAAAVMARRTVEAVAADKGESSGSLADRVKNLADRQILPPAIAEWATEVRLLGNAGAHFDPITDVTEEAASELIGFLRELLKYLYELPSELEKRRLARKSP